MKRFKPYTKKNGHRKNGTTRVEHDITYLEDLVGGKENFEVYLKENIISLRPDEERDMARESVCELAWAYGESLGDKVVTNLHYASHRNQRAFWRVVCALRGYLKRLDASLPLSESYHSRADGFLRRMHTILCPNKGTVLPTIEPALLTSRSQDPFYKE